MRKKFISLMLSVLLANLAAIPVYSQSQNSDDARRIEKIKEGVRKLGTGPEARVELKLADGRKIKGYIREATDESFTVVEDKTGLVGTITYLEVSNLKGKNGLTAAKVGLNVAKGVGIVAGVAAAFTLLLYLVIPRT